jgi:hypothetical protein
MAEEIQRSKGRPSNYKTDRGGNPSESGPFLGIVKNNIDPTRSGRLQVYIEAFGDGGKDDNSKWVTVRYLPPFYGATSAESAKTGDGKYPGNQNSYGMWFTPPDLGVTVICIFVNGDRSQGYYIGVVPQDGINHMIPAIGAEENYITDGANQSAYFAKAPLLPVTEINSNNNKIDNAGRFFDQAKPVQSAIAATYFQQGVAKDPERGPIRSSAQRESPSAVFGISTPGTAIYQGGLKPSDARKKLNSGTTKPADMAVIGRVGGHTFVMDDGDIDGNNQLFRLRTSKGHQITMNDTGNFIHIMNGNGQTWIELGTEGTVDVYSTNSINLRSQGDVNIHADRDINMFAGGEFRVKAGKNINMEATVDTAIQAQKNVYLVSKGYVGMKADGSLTIESKGATNWKSSGAIKMNGSSIDLNSGSGASVVTPPAMQMKSLDDTKFNASTGWEKKTGALQTVCSRAPTHEPYPYHDQGVDVTVDLQEGSAPPPGAEPVPAGVQIRAK